MDTNISIARVLHYSGVGLNLGNLSGIASHASASGCGPASLINIEVRQVAGRGDGLTQRFSFAIVPDVAQNTNTTPDTLPPLCHPWEDAPLLRMLITHLEAGANLSHADIDNLLEILRCTLRELE